ncbi:hypothetical protein QBC38DRAFT_377488 [Podospora fimiseda]|uniref:Uncharacterized protein n=1 Tax=Podospora fimiseda TaxID=252190 RepID=A0AAN6YL23_9PEZI|nr:hypothetical protein QBC38DRAFT_377488 [Podospora fimiseda]
MSDPYTVHLRPSGSTTTTETITCTAVKRFELVSSFYGPGNCLYWFFLLFSVAINWSGGRKTKDSITNEFIAAITMPSVAVGHYIYLVLSSSSTFPEITLEGIQFMVVLEAPLNI